MIINFAVPSSTNNWSLTVENPVSTISFQTEQENLIGHKKKEEKILSAIFSIVIKMQKNKSSKTCHTMVEERGH